MVTKEKSRPKYLQIADYLQQKINDGEYRPADRIPSESELMKQFDVSRIVVINALTRLVNNGSIVRHPGKGSFVAHTPISTTVTPSDLTMSIEAFSPSIAFIIPSIMDMYSISLAQEIVVQAKKRNAFCSIYYSNNNPEMEASLLKQIYHSNYQGVILFPSDQEIYNIELYHLMEKNFPIVLLDRELPGLGISCVQTDHKKATKIAVSELVKLGHKRISICTQTPLPTHSVSQRIDGYLSQMGKANLLVDPSLILTDLGHPDNLKKLENVIATQSATAFICLSLGDLQTVSNQVFRQKKTFPKDFSVITFDDCRNYNWQSEYPSMILQNATAIGQNAIDILFEMIETSGFLSKQIIIPPTYLPGNSTSVPLQKQ